MDMFRNSMILYRPSLSVWTARKKDKDESEKVNTSAGAVAGAANVHKALLPDSAELQAVQKWATSFRTWVYTNTLPWDDAGGRVARVEKHMDFMQEVGDRLRQGDELVDVFMGEYARAVEEARFKLNGMFKVSDYPTASEVRRKFHFELECEPVPAATDFRIMEGLPPEEVDRLVQEATQRGEAKVQAAMDEAYDRLFDVVTKMAGTLKAYGDKEIKKFSDSLVGNIRTLVDLMPSLNLTNDPRLAQLADDARQLTAYDPKDLRTNEMARLAAIADARALAAKFSTTGDGAPLAHPVRDDTADAAPCSSEPVASTTAIPAGILDGWE